MTPNSCNRCHDDCNLWALRPSGGYWWDERLAGVCDQRCLGTRATSLLAAPPRACAGADAGAREAVGDSAQYPLRTDLILSYRTAIRVGVSIAALSALYLLQRLLGDPHWPEVGFLKQMAIRGPTLLAGQATVAVAPDRCVADQRSAHASGYPRNVGAVQPGCAVPAATGTDRTPTDLRGHVLPFGA